jgi:hypothetical protein
MPSVTGWNRRATTVGVPVTFQVIANEAGSSHSRTSPQVQLVPSSQISAT